jgi:hypothetical protein
MRRVFSNNNVVTYDDHIRKKKGMANCNYTIVKKENEYIPPKIMLHAPTSYIYYEKYMSTNINETNTLYPYGLVKEFPYKIMKSNITCKSAIVKTFY